MNDQTVFSLAILALGERRERLENADPVGFSGPIKSCDEAIERLMAMKELNNFLAGVCKPIIEIRYEKHTGDTTDQ